MVVVLFKEVDLYKNNLKLWEIVTNFWDLKLNKINKIKVNWKAVY